MTDLNASNQQTELAPHSGPSTSPEHPERDFIIRALIVVALILALKPLLQPFMGIIMLLFPLAFFVGLRIKALAEDRDPNELLLQYLTIKPFVHAEGRGRFRGLDWLTYGLIAANLLIYYGFQPLLGSAYIAQNLVFLPFDPNLLNVPVSMLSSLFLHSSNAHLWGNMAFLWAMGSVLEKRMARTTYLFSYLGTGVAAGLFSLLFGWVATGGPTHGLGASGAISGLMGIFVVRCYFKSMIIPVPLLGIFSLIVPLAVKVRMNSMVLIGLFFFADLSGGIDQITGASSSNIGHWAHIGGMLAGLAMARRLKLHREAMEERHLDIGEQALNKSLGIGVGEASLRRVLAQNPKNAEAMVLLARTLSRRCPCEEGGDLYRRAIRAQLTDSPQQAAETFREYYAKYLAGVDPQTDLRLARLLAGQADGELASRCLEFIVKEPTNPPSLREKAMFQLAVTLKELGYEEAAQGYFDEFLRVFPESPLVLKVHKRMGAATA